MRWILRIVCLAGSVGFASAADADAENAPSSGQSSTIIDLTSLTSGYETPAEVPQGPVHVVPPAYDVSRYQIEYSRLKSPEYLTMERRVQNTRGGLIAGAITTFIGGLAMSAAFVAYSNQSDPSPDKAEEQDTMLYTLSAITAVGAFTMITTGIVLGARKRKLRKIEERDALRF